MLGVKWDSAAKFGTGLRTAGRRSHAGGTNILPLCSSAGNKPSFVLASQLIRRQRAIAVACSPTGTVARIVPEGLLSREEPSNSRADASHDSSQVIPDGLLSREEPSHAGRRVSSGALRSVPEGLLSREEPSGSENGAPSGSERSVPEGLLSREGAESSAAESGVSAPQFSWFRQWYPVAALNSLDPTRPHAFTLLGQPLVLWRDGSGSWRAFKDACPHRLAPLSEGRIESDGTLMCAYHAWRFDGSGTCTALPFCRPDDPALRSPRSCALPYPTLERGGLLWVWGKGGRGEEAEADKKQPPMPPEVQDDGSPVPGASFPQGWSHRDLPYGHVFFIENVVDPAHVPVSHHNIAGNRYTEPRPFQIDLTRPVSGEGGFEIHIPDPVSTDVESATTEFVPPGYVRIQQFNKNGSRTVLALYSIPIRPGWTRLVGQQMLVAVPGDASARPRSVVGFVGAAAVPQWLGHLLGPLFLNQDLVFLHHQEKEVARQIQNQIQDQTHTHAHTHTHTSAGNGGEAAMAASAPASSPASPASVARARYFTPGTADRGVAAWRTWLFTFGGGDVSYAPGTPPLDPWTPTDNSVLFDVWNSHTRHCTICLTALARIRTVRAVAAAVGVAAAALALAAVAATAAAAVASGAAASGGSAVFSSVLQAAASLLFGSWQGMATLAVAAVAAAVVAVCSRLEGMMHRQEFSHADNN